MTKKLAENQDRLVAPEVRNSSVTIDKILAAAEMEFGKKGLDGAKIEDIARSAGISKQLIYHYFNSKEDLYREMLVLVSNDSYKAFLKIDYESLEPADAIRAYIESLYDRYCDHFCSATLTLDQGLHAGAQVKFNGKAEVLRTNLLAKLGTALARGQKEGRFNSELTVEILHFMSVVTIVGCVSYRQMFNLYTRAELDKQNSEDFWRKFAVDFFMRAIRA